MSNSNRVPKAESAESILLKRLQGMSEYDLTIQVVKPLFLALGFSKVEYTGGSFELGKDLVCHGETRTGKQSIAAVQVKKTRASAVASDTNSLGAILTQLSQAALEPVSLKTGPVLPKEIYFVTPFILETGVIQHFAKQCEKQLNGHNGIEIIDGHSLGVLIKEKLPKKYAELTGYGEQLMELIRNQMNNDPLMKAIRGREGRNVREFFIDIDLTIVSSSTQPYLVFRLQSMAKTFDITSADWRRVLSVDEQCRRTLGVSLFTQSFSEIEDLLVKQERIAKENNKKRKQKIELMKKLTKSFNESWSCMRCIFEGFGLLLSEYDNRVDELEKTRVALLKEMKDLNETLIILKKSQDEKRKSPRTVLKQTLQDLDTCRNQLARTIKRIERLARFSRPALRDAIRMLYSTWNQVSLTSLSIASDKNYEDSVSRGRNACMHIDSLDRPPLMNHHRGLLTPAFEKCVQLIDKAKKSNEEFAPFNNSNETVSITLDAGPACTELTKKRQLILRKIKAINESPSSDRVEAFLAEFTAFLQITRQLSAEQMLDGLINFSAWKSSDKDRLPEYRVTAPLSIFFETGKNFVVLGEAGAGKTTSLMHYYLSQNGESKSEKKSVFFVHLGKLASEWERSKTKKKDLQTALAAYFKSLSSDCGFNDVTRLLRDSKCCLLLDGLDEATKVAPWLVAAVRKATDEYPELQIIVSCRSSEKLASQVPFPTLGILPFTANQLNSFLVAWFGASSSDEEKNERHTNNVQNHLKNNPELADVVTSPLLATVLCILEENEIELPTSDVFLFSKRMQLACGELDAYKGIASRLDSEPEHLYITSRGIAFFLQSSATRYDDFEAIRAGAWEIVRKRLSFPKFERALTELIDPCMVLVEMTGDGGIGFGHRAFQEFLAAEEMRYNRTLGSMDMKKILTNDWWLNVCVYLAKLDGEFEWMIDKLVSSDIAAAWKSNLGKMVRSRPLHEQQDLLRHARARVAKVISLSESMKEINL